MDWQMPDMDIEAGEFLVFWASGNPANGQMHTNFKLSAGGEQIEIFKGKSDIEPDNYDLKLKLLEFQWRIFEYYSSSLMILM